MDDRNGEVFDHHAQLLAEFTTEHLLEQGGLLDQASAGSKALNLFDVSGTSQEYLWGPSFNSNDQMININRNNCNIPGSTQSLPNQMHDGDSAFFESIAKGFTNTDAILDPFAVQNFCDKKINPNTRQSFTSHVPGSILDGLHRMTTDKVTSDYSDNISRSEANDSFAKFTEFDTAAWNRAICEFDLQSQNRSMLNSQASIDKNGNSAVFNNTLGDKIQVNYGPNPSEHLSHNNFITRLSPSASVESNVQTPTTSYESASPLSSNRTPIRSDESISPMGSGHTPLRTDDSTSPLAIVKTPLRMDEGSPMGRTPLRTEEGFSPAACTSLPSRAENSPSHKPSGQTPQRFENYSSPPSFPKKVDVKSPLSCILPSPTKAETPEGSAKAKESADDNRYHPGANDVQQTKDAESGRGAMHRINDIKVKQEGTDFREADKHGEYSKEWYRKSAKTDASGKSDDSSSVAITHSEALNKSRTNKKILIPFVSATRIDDPVMVQKAAKRTFPRKSDSDLYSASSSSPRKSENESVPEAANEVSGIKTEMDVPERKMDELRGEAQDVRDTEAISSCIVNQVDPKKRRKKTADDPNTPAPKRRRGKNITMYQSSVSPDETGIKLKIKLAPSFPPPKTPKKRRSKKQYTSDDEDGRDRPNKKTKKCVRFSSGTKEPDTTEQGVWGNKIPEAILQRIFQNVIDEQGCVPSLVRFSSVCKLWNTVASRSELWQNIDLSSPYIKQKCRIDRYFRWLLENRLGNIHDLNLNGWKFSNITMILSLIGTHCTDIESIGLAGWQGLHYEHLKSLLQDCSRLAKLDLSDVSPESKSANSAVSQKSITFLTQTMGERLTQLILAHNTLTCLPQIISSLATYCPNLQVLDLSNIRRVSHAEFALNIEHLQEGCQKLRVLRITNSCVTLANVPLEKQVASPGFLNLEELSIAGHQGTESLRITSVMDDNCLERMLKTSHKLKLLDVRGCTRITDSSLVRVPAWDIQHLFLSGCYVTRQSGSGLELIAQKWSHSLVEIDLAWTTVTEDLNAAVMAFAEKGSESALRIMNLCGSAVTLEPVKALLAKCPNLESLNLQSCRGLPRGIKRLYENEQLIELRSMLERKDRDSVSESEDKKGPSSVECESKLSPACSTNNKNDDLVT